MQITNTYEEPTTSKTATKVWEADSEGLRPESIEVQLLANGEEVEGKTAILSAENNWTAEFADLQKYETLTRKEIIYSVKEVEVPEGYTSKVEGMQITNTYEEPITSKTATKTWIDDNENVRPTEITVQLLANGKVIGTTILSKGNNWTAEFKGLQKYEALTQNEITYSIKEVKVPEGYTSENNKDNPMNLINSYNEPTVTKTAIKSWLGDNENIRPTSITVQLYKNGEKVEGKTAVLDKGNNWTAEFAELQKYEDLTKTEIVYSIKEVELPHGYTCQIDKNNPMHLTNTYTDPTTSVTVTKKWEDNNNALKERPQSIKVQLKGNGTVKAEEVLTVDNKSGNNANVWTYTFNNLPVYDSISANRKQIT